MKHRVKNWFQKKLGKGQARPHQNTQDDQESSDSDHDVPHIPVPRLPDIRPHVLTPSPSTETLATSSSSLIFEKLPRELRREILILAFGGGLVHMDLSFVHPVAPREPGRLLCSHAGINADDVHSYNPPRVNWDTAAPKAWQWWSSVCHRVLPDHERSAIDRLRGVKEPGEDYCRYGAPHYCENWPGLYPSKCKIGAMGWLLSCRQAYKEGIDVLYRTNTIHMSGPALILNLPQLLLPQRLSAIASLEIVCPLKLRGAKVEAKAGTRVEAAPKIGAVPDVGCLKDYLAVLDSSLPNLTRLYLALKAKGTDARPVDMRPVLEVLDAFVTRRSMEQFTVSPSRSVYRPFFKNLREDDAMRYRLDDLPKIIGEAWRNVDGTYVIPISGEKTEPKAQRFASAWPKPPRALHRAFGAETVGVGYWLVAGDDDDVQPYVREHVCFQ